MAKGREMWWQMAKDRMKSHSSPTFRLKSARHEMGKAAAMAAPAVATMAAGSVEGSRQGLQIGQISRGKSYDDFSYMTILCFRKSLGSESGSDASQVNSLQGIHQESDGICGARTQNLPAAPGHIGARRTSGHFVAKGKGQ